MCVITFFEKPKFNNLTHCMRCEKEKTKLYPVLKEKFIEWGLPSRVCIVNYCKSCINKEGIRELLDNDPALGVFYDRRY